MTSLSHGSKTPGRGKGNGKQTKLSQFAKVSVASQNSCKKRPSQFVAETSGSKSSRSSYASDIGTEKRTDVCTDLGVEVQSRRVQSPVDIIDPSVFHLGRYAEYHTRMLRVPDSRRWEVRDATTKHVLSQLGHSAQEKQTYSDEVINFIKSLKRLGLKGLPQDIQTQLEMVSLFCCSGMDAQENSKIESCLLGRFDIVAFPVCADYDASFKAIQTKDHASSCSTSLSGWFWVLHAAAPNIGETIDAMDYCQYKRNDGSLDEDSYIRDVERLWCTILKAMQKLGIEDAVVFPFGMGAFIRNLSLLDTRYASEANMRSLRRRLASCFAKSVTEACTGLQGLFRLHLCLVCVGSEDINNHNVFLEAISEFSQKWPGIKDIIKLCRNVDAFDLSHRLAKERGKSEPKVCLLNGGNRELLGNHWFESGAIRAIDENIHRRSASMSRIAVLLNDGACTRKRSGDELANRVHEFGGRVVRNL